jgi:NodT family efflux transporter outer membrane factor (OMF) lipoprotein
MPRGGNLFRNWRWCPTAVAMLGIGGCAVGPTFHRPPLAVPASYRPAGEHVRGEQPAPMSDRQHAAAARGEHGSWWRLLRSPQLNGLVRQALADNHDVAAAQAALSRARELVTVGAAARYPQIGLNAATGRQKYGAEFLGPDVFPPFSFVGAGVGVDYLLDYLGRTRRTIQESRALEQYQRSELEATRLALTGEVVAQFVTAATAREQIRAVRDLLAQDRRNVALVSGAVAAGSEPRLDVLTAQTELAGDETLLPPLYQKLTTARHALAVLLGQAPASWHSPDPALSELTLPRQVPVSLPSRLLQRRPDIRAAEAQLRAATAAVGIATANLYPQITLSGSLSQEALRPQHLFDASSLAWSLIGGLTAPLFEGGKLQAQRRAALDVLHERADLYQQVVIAAFGQVADALDGLRHDAELRAAQARALELSRHRLMLERESYRAGNSGLLPVLDAQRQRARAELGLLGAEERQYLDTIRLLLAAGGRVGPPERSAAVPIAVKSPKESARRPSPGL